MSRRKPKSDWTITVTPAGDVVKVRAISPDRQRVLNVKRRPDEMATFDPEEVWTCVVASRFAR